jgi:hypothetical protein
MQERTHLKNTLLPKKQNNNSPKSWGYISVIEYLPSMNQDLSSNSSTTEKVKIINKNNY